MHSHVQNWAPLIFCKITSCMILDCKVGTFFKARNLLNLTISNTHLLHSSSASFQATRFGALRNKYRRDHFRFGGVEHLSIFESRQFTVTHAKILKNERRQQRISRTVTNGEDEYLLHEIVYKSFRDIFNVQENFWC